MFSTLAQVHSNARLLLPAARGSAVLLSHWVLAVPRRIFVGAALSALLVGISGKAILTLAERHPSPLFANAVPAAKTAVADRSPPSAALASGKAEAPAPALTAVPATANASRPISAAALPPRAAVSARGLKAAAPAAPAVRHASRPTPAQAAPADRRELQSAASASDPIGDLLRGKHSGSGLPAARQD